MFAMMLGNLSAQSVLSVVDYNVDPSFVLADIKLDLPLRVRNHDTIDHFLKVEVSPQMAAGHEFQFCWDICYDKGHTYSIGGRTVMAQDSLGIFSLYFYPNGKRGVSVVDIRFFSPTDTAIFVEYAFRLTEFGVTSIEQDKQSLPFTISPNPVHHISTKVEFPPHASALHLVVFDAVGKVMLREHVPPFQTSLIWDLGTALKPGNYYLKVQDDTGAQATKPLVVLPE